MQSGGGHALETAIALRVKHPLMLRMDEIPREKLNYFKDLEGFPLP